MMRSTNWAKFCVLVLSNTRSGVGCHMYKCNSISLIFAAIKKKIAVVASHFFFNHLFPMNLKDNAKSHFILVLFTWDSSDYCCLLDSIQWVHLIYFLLIFCLCGSCGERVKTLTTQPLHYFRHTERQDKTSRPLLTLYCAAQHTHTHTTTWLFFHNTSAGQLNKPEKSLVFGLMTCRWT